MQDNEQQQVDILPEVMDIEEFDRQEAAEKIAADAPEPKDDKGILDTDDPRVAALREALKISEAAREALKAQPAAQPLREEPKPQRRAAELYSDEALEQLYQEKGFAAAARAIQQQTLLYAEEVYAPIINSTRNSGLGTLEMAAAQQYPTEFKLFGPEIRSIVANAPDKSAFTTMDGWKNLVAYVRGKDENLQRYIEYKSGAKPEKPADTAREAQRRTAGPTVTSERSSQRSDPSIQDGANYGLDATEMKVADVMGINYADYAKYKRMG